MTIRFLDPIEVEGTRTSINNDPEFRLAAKFFSKDILLVFGESQSIVRVRDGKVEEILLNPAPLDPWSFYVKASTESWEKFLRPQPPPFYNGLFPAMMRQTFEVGGDLESAFAHFWAVTRILDIIREIQNK